MNRLLLSFVLAIITFMQAYAQAPKGINYQGVARDNEGKPIVSKNISVRISILKNATQGEVEYSETHKPQTNQFGLFSLIIGQGTAGTGSFAFVSWAVGNKWLQIEIDPDGGSSFQLAGSQQLMSVPYAFYSEYSGNGADLTAGQGIAIQDGVISNTGDNDNSSTNELITSASLTADKKLRITDAGGTKEVDLNTIANTDNQSLSLTGSTLIISGGNSVDLTSALAGNIQNLSLGTSAGTNRTINITNGSSVTLDVADNDNNSTNEIQDLSITGNTLTLSGDATGVDLAPYLDNTDNQDLSDVLGKGNSAAGLKIQNLGTPTISTDAATKAYVDAHIDGDASNTNELQNLSSSSTGTNRTINITGGTGTTIDVADNDNSATNESQYLSRTGSNITLTQVLGTGGGTVSIDDADANPINEAQTLTKTGTTVSLSDVSGSGGGSFIINDDSGTNEAQTLSKSGANIILSNVSGVGGGSVLLNDDSNTNEAQSISRVGSTVTMTPVGSTGGGSFSVDDSDADPTNEIQTLTKSGTTISLSNGGGSITLNDDSETNEIQDLALNTGTNILSLTKVATSVDLTPYKQNLTYNQGTNNLAISGGNNVTISTTLTQVLNTNPSASNIRIQNVGAPTTNTDATTKGYVDTSIATAIATNYAFKTSYTFINTGGTFANAPILLSEDFDDFNVVGSNRFTAPSAGVYSFNVTGSSTLGGIPIRLKITSGTITYFDIKRQQSYPLASTINYHDSIIFKLNAGDTVELVVSSTSLGERVEGFLFGHKL